MAAFDDNLMREAFCVAYVNDRTRNGTQAAIAAGYSDKPECAAVQASRLLRNVKVKSRIRELEMEMFARSGYKGEDIDASLMRELVAIAFADVTDYVCVSDVPELPDRPAKDAPQQVWDEYNAIMQVRNEAMDEIAKACGGQSVLDFGGTIYYPNRHLTREQTCALKNINVQNIGNKFPILAPNIELHDKMAAIKLLAEIRGMKDSDGSVNLQLSPTLILEQVESRREAVHA